MRAVYFIHIHRIYYCYYFDHITWNIYGGNFYPLFPNNQCVNLYFLSLGVAFKMWIFLQCNCTKCFFTYMFIQHMNMVGVCFGMECLFRDVVYMSVSWCGMMSVFVIMCGVIYISHQMQMSTSLIFFILGHCFQNVNIFTI